MIRVLSRSFLFLLAALILAGQCQAGQWYVRAGGGIDWSLGADFSDRDPGSRNPPALFGEGPSSDGRSVGAYGDFGTFPAFEIAVGTSPVRWLRTDLSLSYRTNMDYRGQANFGGVPGEQPVSASAESWTGMANAFLEVAELLRLDLGVFTPYIGGGIGLSRNRLGEMTYRFPGNARHKVSVTPSGTRTDFAYMVCVGTGIRLSGRLVLDLSYRYSDLGTMETDAGNMYMDTRPAGIGIAPTRAPFRSQGAFTQLRYQF